jgi:hypothetical protein
VPPSIVATRRQTRRKSVLALPAAHAIVIRELELDRRPILEDAPVEVAIRFPGLSVDFNTLQQIKIIQSRVSMQPCMNGDGPQTLTKTRPPVPSLGLLTKLVDRIAVVLLYRGL